MKTIGVEIRSCAHQSAQGPISHGMMHIPGLGAAGDALKYVLQPRKRYDLQPDVMIYNRNDPGGYPNGRRLDDDIVGIACELGDCVLQEVASFEEEVEWERIKTHDPPFLSEFPYLLPRRVENWGEAEHSDRCVQTFVVVVVVLIVLWIWWRRRKQDRAETPWVR